MAEIGLRLQRGLSMKMIHKVEPASNAGRLHMSDAPEHRLRTLVKHLTLPLMILFLATISAWGQLTTSDILGIVTDGTGAAITNATITIRNLGTNDTRVVKTNENGDYSFNILQPGHYSIRVEAPGFKSSNTENLAVEA